MNEISGSYYSEDQIFKEVELLDSAVFSKGTVLYEVLRILDRKPLFLEDHVARLQESVRLSGYSYQVSLAYMGDLLNELIRTNGISMGNVKINFVFNDHHPSIYTFFIPHAYPDHVMYNQGVNADFFHASRKNPNVKKLNSEIIRQVTAIIRSRQLYDVVLVGDEGLITEGSKTNLFFIRNNEVITAPGDKVLRGITREKVIGLCNNLGVKLQETLLSKEDLSGFDAAFFSGTSPKILPIRNIAGMHFQPNDITLRTLMKKYDELIDAYLKSH